MFTVLFLQMRNFGKYKPPTCRHHGGQTGAAAINRRNLDETDLRIG
jgi:hypothetical protein